MTGMQTGEFGTGCMRPVGVTHLASPRVAARRSGGVATASGKNTSTVTSTDSWSESSGSTGSDVGAGALMKQGNEVPFNATENSRP
jgi:hypothetical protein